MAEARKIVKFEVESADGTTTDLTPFIRGAPSFIMAEHCSNCLKPFPHYRFFKRLRQFLFARFHKCKPVGQNYIDMLKGVSIEIRGTWKTRRIDFWRWN
jgi:hypothetical protein